MKKIFILTALMTLSFFVSNGQDKTVYRGFPVMEAIDLGLSVKFANMNLGADFPEDFGDCYAWGEIESNKTIEDYSWKAYKWCNNSKKRLTKYNTISSCGIIDNKTKLDAEDDVAHVKLGGNWRMPTKSELEELISTKYNTNYKWEFRRLNGIPGLMITYLKNNNCIFLPAAGMIDGYNYYWRTYSCRYWSSSLVADSSSDAWSLETFKAKRVKLTAAWRSWGLYIRPVSE